MALHRSYRQTCNVRLMHCHCFVSLERSTHSWLLSQKRGMVCVLFLGVRRKMIDVGGCVGGCVGLYLGDHFAAWSSDIRVIGIASLRIESEYSSGASLNLQIDCFVASLVTGFDLRSKRGR
jgi:hypothetical protein